MLRLVGASPSYVRAPFLLEGAALGGFGALLALMTLGAAFVWLHQRFEASFGQALGVRPMFLSLAASVVFVVGGSTLGAMGSALALRRWLRT